MKIKILNLIPFVLVAVLLMSTVIACTETTPEATTRTITDMAGRTVEIPVKVDRVATSFPATNQIIFMLGAGDKLVGTVEGIQNRAWFVEIYPEIAELPRPFNSDGSVNTETLLGLDPDVVILTTGSDANAAKIEELGIPVLMFGFTDPDTLKQGVELIGTVLGEEELAKANQWVDYFDDNIERVTSVTSLIPTDQRPRMYYCASGPLNTEGQDTLVQWWMETGGGVNVAAENGIVGGFKDVNMEDLLEWNPDYIVCRDAPYKATILADASWQDINAVKNGNVLVNPQGVFYWCVRSAEESLQILWVAKTLYPDEFSDMDLVQEVKDYYETFHDYTLSEEDVNSILYPQK